MNDIQEYLVAEFIEEYEDGHLGRRDLERRVDGILGRDAAARLLATVPTRPEPAHRRPPAFVPIGGGYTWRVTTQAGTRLRAAVPWYGPNPPSGVATIGAPVFAIYGALDQRINAGIDAIVREMASGGKPFEHKIYPNAQHAFNNDANPERYNPEQAKVAWDDMLRFFARQL